MKVAHIVGARPQFIKYFPVLKATDTFNRSARDTIRNILIHTGQHYDYEMSKIFFDELGIKEPDYHLGVGSGSHGVQTGQILQRVEEVLGREMPDVLMVYGDTNSTLGGALAGAKFDIPVVHVEAGLRSFNKHMPEEVNRLLTDHISTLLLCPSELAVKNLVREGFSHIQNNGKLIPLDGLSQEKKTSNLRANKNSPLVINVGDVMYDVLLHSIIETEKYSGIMGELGLNPKDYYLLTLHRAENTDDPQKLDELINFVNLKFGGKRVIFPMHPRTRKVYEKSKPRFASGIEISKPLGYFDALCLLKNSALLLTDSGGMQKEAYWFKVPCITLREETEWEETLESGWNVLYKDYHGMHKPVDSDGSAYGDGKAAQRIVDVLIQATMDRCKL